MVYVLRSCMADGNRTMRLLPQSPSRQKRCNVHEGIGLVLLRSVTDMPAPSIGRREIGRAHV